MYCVIRHTRNIKLPSFVSSTILNRTSCYQPFVNRTLLNQFSSLAKITSKKSTKFQNVFFRSKYHEALEQKNKNTFYYLSAFTILVGGFTYSSVLLYRLYCQTTGKGGQAVVEDVGDRIAEMKVAKHRNIVVKFNADVNSAMRWNFKPQQPFITVAPGETALAFYSALNPTDKPITGVATYNVLPFEAGKYFNKIQCFCFEEQQLNPHEEVDMPVFFYLDPDYAEDPRLEHVNDIILSYTFFEAKQGMQLPRPSFM
ncbi:cytochrome c oxidase assembly protein ctaG [Parasteatoda tepidariorum]|nr:cytochrome c oxidase assembly protein COX11, mitochondrial [Parasteatoda tepidariorum]